MPITFLNDFFFSINLKKLKTESRRSHDFTALSGRKVVLFEQDTDELIFTEGVIIFVRSKGKCCVILANSINCGATNKAEPCYFAFMK